MLTNSKQLELKRPFILVEGWPGVMVGTFETVEKAIATLDSDGKYLVYKVTRDGISEESQLVRTDGKVERIRR
jgi:hypothetical protein